MLIDHHRHTFLNQDSYIDCTDMQSIPLELIKEQITAKPLRKLGKATDDIIGMVMQAVEKSPTTPALQINWVLTALANI